MYRYLAGGIYPSHELFGAIKLSIGQLNTKEETLLSSAGWASGISGETLSQLIMSHSVIRRQVAEVLGHPPSLAERCSHR
jgi:hypothetical protein